MFKDEAEITVTAGKGGDGCVSFRREAFAPRGGPDGGDGGRGGDVVFEAADDVNSLLELVRRRKIRAEDGKDGMGANCAGRNGAHVVVKVPVGTVVFDTESGKQLADLTLPRQHFVAARGGQGGFGNKHFATSVNQTPQQFKPGERGQAWRLRLELKLIADVGLAGLPNAGKSTLLSRCSAARPKIAAYPFTTLEPGLGIVSIGHSTFVMADIPGLIEGASLGKGLGHQFLRHIERTRVLVHLVDMSAGDVEKLVGDYRVIRRELEEFSPVLAAKPELVVANKIDIPEARELVDAFGAAIGKEVVPISGATGENIHALVARLMSMVMTSREGEPVRAMDDEVEQEESGA